MPISSTKRFDLGAWLADLRRIGGQARTLAERHEALESRMELTDLQMLEEAAKRLIVSLSKQAIYGLPVPRSGDPPRLLGYAGPASGHDGDPMLPQGLPSPDLFAEGSPAVP